MGFKMTSTPLLERDLKELRSVGPGVDAVGVGKDNDGKLVVEQKQEVGTDARVTAAVSPHRMTVHLCAGMPGQTPVGFVYALIHVPSDMRGSPH